MFGCFSIFVIVNSHGGQWLIWLWKILAEAPGFSVVSLADTPRRVVMCRALQAWQSLATGTTHNAGETHLPNSASDEGQIGLRS